MEHQIETDNLSRLTEHFQEGCKQNCIQKLGVEIEHFVVHTDTKMSITYYEEHGVEALLNEIAAFFPRREIYAGKHMIGMYNQDYSISIEPAGQLEISIAPRESVSSIQQIYHHFLRILLPVLDKYHLELVTTGYQPASLIRDLPLIPKKRYGFMDEYFHTSGSMGANMMRGTASAQVSIDYCSEEDFVLKYRVANLLMPLFKLMTDNTPIFEGVPYKGHMARTEIWHHVDPARTGVLDAVFQPDFGFSSYAQYLWQLPLIFVAEGDTATYVGDKTAAEIWQDRPLTDADIDHILSMTFLDVRLKHYIEMRGADCMPFPYVCAYTAMIKGLFFHSEVLRQLWESYPVTAQQVRDADEILMRDGYDGMLYGIKASDLAASLLERASEKLPPGEIGYLQPLKELTAKKETLKERSCDVRGSVCVSR